MARWNFDKLSEAKPDTLEKLMRECPAPDYAALDGFRYMGWNHGWGASLLSGEKLSKAFLRDKKKTVGFNEVILQDLAGPKGKWNRLMVGGRPVQLAFYRFARVKDEPEEPWSSPYPQAGVLHYGLPKLNTGVNVIFQCIRDVIVCPNPGDHELLLCKAHFRRSARKADFYCYFQLGKRVPIDFPPWG